MVSPLSSSLQWFGVKTNTTKVDDTMEDINDIMAQMKKSMAEKI